MNLAISSTTIIALLFICVAATGQVEKHEPKKDERIYGHAGGQALNPGEFNFAYSKDMTVSDVIELLGGLAPCAEKEPRTTITRVVNGESRTYRAALSTILKPGDVVSISYCPFF